MRHYILRRVTPLVQASTDDLERGVNDLIMEAEVMGDEGYDGIRASRAEALAIIGHELRRRQAPTPGEHHDQ